MHPPPCHRSHTGFGITTTTEVEAPSVSRTCRVLLSFLSYQKGCDHSDNVRNGPAPERQGERRRETERKVVRHFDTYRQAHRALMNSADTSRCEAHPANGTTHRQRPCVTGNGDRKVTAMSDGDKYRGAIGPRLRVMAKAAVWDCFYRRKAFGLIAGTSMGGSGGYVFHPSITGKKNE